ncbi:hypothetical protein [Burkholderia pseudomallei]|uniref:hypothetical protein n=1 Tax=Burkholderia pseudomallei TaxID=28450 RepID=UPI0018C5611B|nr:hypothetical protein [Burkholderia pseudomallei]MBG1251343.1 hypothetical protein [Burkholderia pseudomallei]
MNRVKKRLVTDPPRERRHPLESGGEKITTFVPLRFAKRGHQKVVVGPCGVDNPVEVIPITSVIPPTLDARLLRTLGRGFYWRRLLDSGEFSTAAEIADREGVHKVTVNDAVRLSLLAPAIVEAALKGSLSRTISLEALLRTRMPADWNGQQRTLAAPAND